MEKADMKRDEKTQKSKNKPEVNFLIKVGKLLWFIDIFLTQKIL